MNSKNYQLCKKVLFFFTMYSHSFDIVPEYNISDDDINI